MTDGIRIAPPHRRVVPAGPRCRGRRVALRARRPASRPSTSRWSPSRRRSTSSRRRPTWSASSCSTSTSRSTPSTRSATLVPMLAEVDAEDLGRRQDLQHHAAQGRQAAQRPRAQRRRRGRQPASAGWTVSPRGKSVAAQVADAVRPRARSASRSVLKNAVRAAALAARAWPRAWPPSWPRKRSRTPLREFVGTGPYKFKERKPDQYVLLTRFDDYCGAQGGGQRLRRQARGA